MSLLSIAYCSDTDSHPFQVTLFINAKMSRIFDDFQISGKIGDNLRQQTKSIHVFDDNNGENALILTTDDKVYSLGSNQFGCCGLGHNNAVNVPQVVPEICNKGIKQFFNGIRFVLGLTRDNELYGWGRNYWGQLGRGYASDDQNEYLRPETIVGYISESIAHISCGQSHSLLLTSQGKVYGWGANDYGQVGCGLQSSSKVARITHLKFTKSIKAINCAFDRSFAITTDGLVYSWGYNQTCQLGHELGRNECVYEPKLVAKLKDIEFVCPSTDNTYFLSKEGFIYFCGHFRYESNRESYQLLPKQIKTDLKINKFESKFSSKVRKWVSTAVTDHLVYLLSSESLIETNYKKFYDFYAKEYQITCETIDITPVPTRVESKVNVQLQKPAATDNGEDGPELRRASSLNGLFDSKFQVLAQIGSGGFGTVFKVRDTVDRQVYAVKKIEFDVSQTDEHRLDRLLGEATTLAKIRDDGVVRYMGSWIETYSKDVDINCLYIQMEFCSDSLKNILNSKALVFGRKPLETMSVIEYFVSCQLFKELLECVQYLHESNPPIIHRDLKPQNILIADNPLRGKYLKICDFGLATVHSMSSMSHTRNTGTFKYMAPEVLQGTRFKSDYSTKADVYSLSIIAMELFDFDVNKQVQC